jgi:hypothetical protein
MIQTSIDQEHDQFLLLNNYDYIAYAVTSNKSVALSTLEQTNVLTILEFSACLHLVTN